MSNFDFLMNPIFLTIVFSCIFYVFMFEIDKIREFLFKKNEENLIKENSKEIGNSITEISMKYQNEFLKTDYESLNGKFLNDISQVLESIKPVDTKLNINTASTDEIADLYGLNIISAKKLTEYRSNIKQFSNIDEIVDLLQLKPHVRLKLSECLVFDRILPEQAVEPMQTTVCFRGRVVDY